MKIIAPFAEVMKKLGYPEGGSRSINPEYLSSLSTALQTKFQGAKVETAPSGVIRINGQATDNINYELTAFVTPNVEGTINISVTGSTHGSVSYGAKFYQPMQSGGHRGEVASIPFQFGKDVFYADDQNVVADWIYTEVYRKIKQTDIKLKGRQ